MLRLVVGLGNPGERYRHTRHNAGFFLADHLGEKGDAAWQSLTRDLGVLGRCANGLLLLKPATFMNDSGRSVCSVAGYYKIPPCDILVAFDEVALPLGRLRLRGTGSDGGHNGLKSIIASFGTQDIPRLRLGIGGATSAERKHPAQDLSNYVLAPFEPDEAPTVEAMIARAADCVETILRSGLDAAMNSANRDDTKQKA